MHYTPAFILYCVKESAGVILPTHLFNLWLVVLSFMHPSSPKKNMNMHNRNPMATLLASTFFKGCQNFYSFFFFTKKGPLKMVPQDGADS